MTTNQSPFRDNLETRVAQLETENKELKSQLSDSHLLQLTNLITVVAITATSEKSQNLVTLSNGINNVLTVPSNIKIYCGQKLRVKFFEVKEDE